MNIFDSVGEFVCAIINFGEIIYDVDDLIWFALAHKFPDDVIVIDTAEKILLLNKADSMRIRAVRYSKNEKFCGPIHMENTRRVSIDIGYGNNSRVISVRSNKKSINKIMDYISTKFDWIRNIYKHMSVIPSIEKIEENIDGLKHIFDFRNALVKSLMDTFALYDKKILFRCDDYALDDYMIRKSKFTDNDGINYLEKTHCIKLLFGEEKYTKYLEVVSICICDIFNSTRENNKSKKLANDDRNSAYQLACLFNFTRYIKYGNVFFKICAGGAEYMQSDKYHIPWYNHSMMCYDKDFKIDVLDQKYKDDIENGRVVLTNKYRDKLRTITIAVRYDMVHMDSYIHTLKSYYETTNRYLSYGFKLDDEHDHFKEFIFSYIAKDKVYSCCANGALYYKLNYDKDKTIVCQCDIHGKKCKKSYKYETIFKSITIKMYANDVIFLIQK